MVSVLRQLQAEWNAIVPQAQALSIRRVRPLNAPLESIEYRRTKLEWLRGEIARLSATTSLTQASVVQDLSVLTFGVELEFIVARGQSRGMIASAITLAGVDCRSETYNHNTGGHWKITTDASVGYDAGAEIVSPVLRGEPGLEALAKVCRVLKNLGCKVNKKCGLHVHVGAREWELDAFKRLALIYANAETSIDSFMAPSRRGMANNYCQPVSINRGRLDRAVSMDDIAHAMGQVPGRTNVRGAERYRKLNLMSFWQHGTVEFRQHQGTVEEDKACHWTRLCLRMCLAAMEGPIAVMPASFDGLFECTKSPDAEKAFFQGRVDFFASQVRREERRTTNAIERRLTGLRRAPRPFLEPSPAQEPTNPFEQTAEILQRAAHTGRR
jgi:Putative amidoligase enzyme